MAEEVWRLKSLVLSAETPGRTDPSSERVLPFCARGPHACSSWQQKCDRKRAGDRPRLAEECKSNTTRPPAALGPDGQASCSFARARIHAQPQTPGLSPEGKAANPVTPAKAMPREKRGCSEDPRKAECAPSHGKDRCRANEREAGRRGAGGGRAGA